MKIVHPDGKWFCHNAAFPIFDPESGHVFQPGEPVKIKPNDWMAGQSTIAPTTDPTQPAPAPVAPAKASK